MRKDAPQEIWYARELSAPEFSRRLRQALEGTDVRVVWFVGAGCSISSGIPAAAELVRRWLPQLGQIRTGSRDEWEVFATEHYPDWRSNAAAYYGRVIEDLFESEEDRQREIERLTAGKDPGFGYAALAQLMSLPEIGPKANVAITVNFDDLIADSLYLYTAKKPLVIGHEALTRFIRRGDRTPLVVKVHGDARLAPKNTTDETSTLDVDLVHAVQRLCARARVVIAGYAGADQSIARVFLQDIGEVGPEVVYWVNEEPPEGPLRASLSRTPARVSWVHHLDFDSLMFELHSYFKLGLPDFKRLRTLQKAYESTLEKLRDSEGAAVGDGDSVRKRSVDELLEELRASQLVEQAESLAESDPDKAEELFEVAVAIDPDDDDVLRRFASFMHEVRNDTPRAVDIYQRAVEANADDIANLLALAELLGYLHSRPDETAALFERSLALNPDDTQALTSYALFLSEVTKDFERAETLFQRALALDLDDGGVIGNYGLLLLRKGDLPEARVRMQRAVELDPWDPDLLGNYAGILYLDGRAEEARDLVRRARQALPNTGRPPLKAELAFYRLCYESTERDAAIDDLRSSLPFDYSGFTIDLRPHVDKARATGHPDLGLIERAARAIAEREDAAFLRAEQE